MTPVSLAFAPGGDRLALGAWDKGIDLLEIPSGQRLGRLEGQDGWGRGAWTPDGRRYVSASVDGHLRVWDPASGSLLLTLPLSVADAVLVDRERDNRAVLLRMPAHVVADPVAGEVPEPGRLRAGHAGDQGHQQVRPLHPHRGAGGGIADPRFMH